MPSWKDVEDYAAQTGKPIQQAAQELGMSFEQGLEPVTNAIQKMSSGISGGPQGLPGSASNMNNTSPDPGRNDATLMDQSKYEKNLRDRLQQIGDEETARQKESDSFNPADYKNYAMGGDVSSHDSELGKDRFSHLKEMIKKHRKANSELEASKNPEKFMEKNKNMSIRGLKGVAF